MYAPSWLTAEEWKAIECSFGKDVRIGKYCKRQ